MTEYEKYQLEWLRSHGHSIRELIEELESYINEADMYVDNKVHLIEAFNDWENEIGFSSEIYACPKEYEEMGG